MPPGGRELRRRDSGRTVSSSFRIFPLAGFGGLDNTQFSGLSAEAAAIVIASGKARSIGSVDQIAPRSHRFARAVRWYHAFPPPFGWLLRPMLLRAAATGAYPAAVAFRAAGLAPSAPSSRPMDYFCITPPWISMGPMHNPPIVIHPTPLLLAHMIPDRSIL